MHSTKLKNLPKESVAATELALLGKCPTLVRPGYRARKHRGRRESPSRQNEPELSVMQIQSLGPAERGDALHKQFEHDIERRLTPENQFSYWSAQVNYRTATAIAIGVVILVWSIVLAPQ